MCLCMSVKRNIIRNRIFSTVVGTFYSNISKNDELNVFSNATVRKNMHTQLNVT